MLRTRQLLDLGHWIVATRTYLALAVLFRGRRVGTRRASPFRRKGVGVVRRGGVGGLALLRGHFAGWRTME